MLVVDDSFVQAVSSAAEHLFGCLHRRRLLIALSGGPDSTALLAAFVAVREQHELTLHVLHVNHGLRGAESSDDEEFCRRLCAAWAVNFRVRNLPGVVADEAQLREERYAALRASAEELSVNAVCTGHTLDDQAETLLFRLFRGTSPAGMLGIPASRKLHERSQIIVMRPMVSLRRSEVLDFLQRAQIPYRIDSSNTEQRYSRNFIRHTLLPQIQQRFPATVYRLESFRTMLSEDQGLLDELAEAAHESILLDSAHPCADSHELLVPDRSDIDTGGPRDMRRDGDIIGASLVPQEQWRRDLFLQQPASLQRRIITHSLRARASDVSFALVERLLQLCRAGDGELCLGTASRIVCTGNRIQWYSRPLRHGPEALGFVEKTVLLPGLTEIAELRATIMVSEFVADPAKPDDLPYPPAQSFQALVDLSRIAPPLVLRLRRAGDRIQPFGMSQLVRLKKYLHTHKSPAVVSTRAIPVLADQHEVLWVPGIGLSEKLRTRGMPTHRLEFSRWKPS